MASVPPGAADRARALFGDFIEGRWEETREEFHENFRGHLDAARIAQGWAHMASSAEGFERVGERVLEIVAAGLAVPAGAVLYLPGLADGACDR